MKVVECVSRDGYEVVVSVDEMTIDPVSSSLTGTMVYFPPSAGKKEIMEEQYTRYKTLLESLQPFEVLLSTGSVVKDYTSLEFLEYFQNSWRHVRVLKIGEPIPASYKTPDTMSLEEIESYSRQVAQERVSKLSPKEKDDEKQVLIQGALSQAAIKKSEFELLGKPSDEALRLSKEWYNTRVQEINNLYK